MKTSATALAAVPYPLLKKVSRSFYLSLRWLPSAVRPQLSLAYLLARATDTVADTELVPLPQRLETLRRWQKRIVGETPESLNWREIAGHQDRAAERELLEIIEDLVGMMEAQTEEDCHLIRHVLGIITSGQILDLERFGKMASCEEVRALANRMELEDYAYRVAGCVGEFWTRLCFAHLRPLPETSLEKMVTMGVAFGKGLQLVNILRDLPRDLRQGRCYLPVDELRARELRPTDLLEPSAEAKLRPVYDSWLEQARAWLREGWQYTLALPAGWWRVRLACALPVLIGIKTLVKLQHYAILNPDLRIKVTRQELRAILWRMVLCHPWPKKWKQLPDSPFFLKP